MANITFVEGCPMPFLNERLYSADDGYVRGRLCQAIGDQSCCLPCPLPAWVYPDSFLTVQTVANWVAAAGTICCVLLLSSWIALPVEKTNRHYLSICLTIGVAIMNLGFVVPLAARPDQCYDDITPHSMHTSRVCGVSGSLIILGGWSGVMWVFLRSLSLHLQICWQVLVGRTFMIFAQIAGWGVPIIGLILALVFSGVSFRFGATCHINHTNSLADFWIPMLIFAGLTVILTFATFGYCIKVYLASLSDNSASTEGSSLPHYNDSVQSISPRQAYRRVRRVIHLQWRGIAIVLIIIADVIFFSVVFVFQDNSVQAVADDPSIAARWVLCLSAAQGDADQCYDRASNIVVNLATVTAVLLLLALNGIWLLFLLGRWSMATGWIELVQKPFAKRQREFVSADARLDMGKDAGSYEMLGKDTPSVLTPVTPAAKSPDLGRKTPDYFNQTARYHAPARSYSSPRPPQQASWSPDHKWSPSMDQDMNMNPLGMNRM
ncbi:hypothetical protein B0I35DRAFT_473684 [Stachybotrys elegans]|uniref:G-protein coupled receptors family 2 profile 2 domain-containing protein n=1 Tax=Stachybotrys elegans TaxID=80388 RepID=A0A8K0WY11_9HYPO|nr:hypothetical protein B0I35DRAFT_473684 [Stachybotrys elegans]